MDIKGKIRSALADNKLEEIIQVHNFEAYRGMQRIHIEVYDFGDGRYMCKAWNDYGVESTGNTDSSIAGAVQWVHWNEFDEFQERESEKG